ncbi:thiamine pyrophosphokinase [Bartonella bacilliformis Peru38]|uniref:thiamine diphosphokinase n=1 Tax=Bartonella bacilliformis TaxID=774 RepID=UPI00049F1828|nr:thiamine diphosphokinase [Bartonella bacilliformis]KEG22107.1 thiamine pyrophosphokinase [Bartonella bacilliformis Peru38]KEG25105.1 thiamine pyrophosphokinase [Bartonella bacilliformis VAB9028]
MKTFTILLDGDISPTDRLRTQIRNSRVIAADGGMRHAALLNVQPELWVGDFDSTNQALLQQYCDVPREVFSVEKDATDGDLACKKALSQGAQRIILCGAFGGARSDHSLLHMTQAIAMTEKGLSVLLTSGDEEGWPIVPQPFSCDLPDGCLFSLIGFSDLQGLTMSGVQWPLSEYTVSFGSSLTLSNRVCGTFSCQLRSGKAILLASLPVS